MATEFQLEDHVTLSEQHSLAQFFFDTSFEDLLKDDEEDRDGDEISKDEDDLDFASDDFGKD